MPSSSLIPAPITPSHHPTRRRRDSKLRDSPFSDYFTDDARSPELHPPSPEAQNLLLRLNKLQSRLAQGDSENERDILAIVGRKVREMETQLDSVHTQTRLELEDSGLFIEEDEEEDTKTHVAPNDPFNPAPTTAERRAEQDYHILEAQRVLANAHKLEALLRQRHTELRTLSDECHNERKQYEEERDRLEQENENLHSENERLQAESEALQADLAFNRTELLWLGMRMKALEVEMRAADDGARRMEGYAPELGEEIQTVKWQRVGRELRRWEGEWAEVEAQMQKRGRTWSLSLEQELDSESKRVDSEEEDGGWRVTVSKRQETGVVQQITLTRASSEAEQADDQSEDSTTKETALYATHGTQTEPTTIRTLSTTSSWVLLDDDTSSTIHQEIAEQDAEDECAIASTSTESSGGDDDLDNESPATDDQAPPQPEVSRKDAWHELWNGLTRFAGMARGEEEDEEVL